MGCDRSTCGNIERVEELEEEVERQRTAISQALTEVGRLRLLIANMMKDVQGAGMLKRSLAYLDWFCECGVTRTDQQPEDPHRLRNDLTDVIELIRQYTHKEPESDSNS